MTKPGRNDPCPCGSGKKYKQCCGNLQNSVTVSQHMTAGLSSPRPAQPPPAMPTQPTPVEMDRLIALFNSGRHMELEKQTHLLVEKYPESGIAWNVLGVALQAQGKDALPALQKAAGFLPNDAGVHSNLGNALRNIGQLDAAAASYRRALQIRPGFAEAHNNLGVVMRDLNQLEGAIASYRQAIAIKPDYAEARVNLGVTLQDLRQLDGAMENYRRALEIKPNYVEAHNNLGNILRDLGHLNDSVECFHRALEIRPNYAEAHSNLGASFLALNKIDDSIACFRRALEINPNFAGAHSNLGNALRELGQLGMAVESYRRAVELKPDFAEAYCNLGATLQTLGQLDDAVASCRQALKIKPDFAEAHCNLGAALQELGQFDDVVASCRRALEIKPDFAEAHNNLGNALQAQGQLENAAASYRLALKHKPDYAEAYCNLGATLQLLTQPDEAEESLNKALELKPDYAEAYIHLGIVLRDKGNLREAKACYRKARELGFNGARTREALMLPAIMGTRQEVLETRAEFERNLDELIAHGEALEDPLKGVGETNFYLAYHGLNDRDLQVKVAKYYEQACPSLLYTAPHCAQPAPDRQKKIRIGFLSKFLYSHSVSLCYSKIIETLSLHEQFEVVLISSHPIDKQIYSTFSGERLQLPNNLVRAREMLAAQELDVLVYLDIGMEPLSYFLAFSRLAQIQCVLSGHPVTTGISNLDYFISTDLMEPPDADLHYSEKLVRLPRPMFYFERPILPATFKTRQELGLPEGRHIYMCPMRLPKLHPDFDAAIARILEKDANGAVILFEDMLMSAAKKTLEDRFEKTIPPELRERILFLPWIRNPSDFISAIAAADVILDPFHFGIGSTAAMAYVTGTPLVTKAGEFMRGRVGMALCNMMDVPECIAEDVESYARIAVEISGNPSVRGKISEKMLRNNHILYDNLESADDFVNFVFSLKKVLIQS